MKILIVSQPKCGSTALFYRIRKALPPTASCLFEPTDLSLIADAVDDSSDVLCKYLLQPCADGIQPDLSDLIHRFDRVVLLHRDPRDFMVSAYLYSFYDSLTARQLTGMAQALRLIETKERSPLSLDFLQMITLKNALERGDYLSADLRAVPAKLDEFGNPIHLDRHPLRCMDRSAAAEQALMLQEDAEAGGFLSYIEASCRAMLELKLELEQCGRPVHWFAYQDMVNERLDALRDFLCLPLTVAAPVEREHRRVVRTKGSGDWKNWCLASDIPWLRQRFSSYLSAFGYADDWSLPEVPAPDPGIGSDYVYRLFQERNELRVNFSRNTLRALARWLRDPSADGALLPDFASCKSVTEGNGAAIIRDIHISDESGRQVACLTRGRRYRYRYRVEFECAGENVDFWMLVSNQNGNTVVNGSSFVAGSTLAKAEPGVEYEIDFPFTCQLTNGLYFANAGITRRAADGIEVLHRQVFAAAFIVYQAPQPLPWLTPAISVVPVSSSGEI